MSINNYHNYQVSYLYTIYIYIYMKKNLIKLYSIELFTSFDKCVYISLKKRWEMLMSVFRVLVNYSF